MVRIIKRSKFSFSRSKQIYECDVPGHCSNPLEQVARFFQGDGVRGLAILPGEIRFERGSFWASLSGGSELSQMHSASIRLVNDASGRRLLCEYRSKLICVLQYPPWPLEKEVQDLEDWLARQTRTHTAPKPGGRVTNTKPYPLGVVQGAINFPFKILYRLYRLFSWSRYKMSRRLTSAGLMVFAALLASVITGLDTENTVAYQAIMPLLFLSLLAVVFSWFFRARFSATRVLPRLGTAGRTFSYRILARNLTSKPQSGLTLLEELADPRPSFDLWRAITAADQKNGGSFRLQSGRRANRFKLATFKEAPMPNAGPNEEVEVGLQLTPLRRGVLHFTGVTMARTDPFGLFRAFSKVPAPQSVLILPKRYPVPPIVLPGAMKYQEGGVTMASNIGQSDEFFSLRDYRRGDPFRHIHWRSWAKTGKPIVKEFEDEFFVRHALVLDTFSGHPRAEVFEEAVSVAASFACTLPTQESLLDLLFVGARAYCFTAGRGLAHTDQMLEILASVETCADKSFATLEDLVLNHAQSVSGCICVLLSWNRERQDFVTKLRSLGVPTLVLIVVEPEKGKGIEPGPMRDEPKRFRVLETGRIEEGLMTL